MKNMKKRFIPIFLSFSLIACLCFGSCATPPTTSKSQYKKKSRRQIQYYGGGFRAYSRTGKAEAAFRAYSKAVNDRKTIHGKKDGTSARIVVESFNNEDELINMLNMMNSIY